jgi:integrase
MGSVHSYETKAGRRYRVLYRKPDNSQGQKRGFKTKRDAEQYQHLIEASKARGEFIDATSARMSIGTLGEEWLANLSHLKPSSFRSVESTWRIHVAPAWSNRAVGSVRHSEVQSWVTGLTSIRGATTVQRAYGALAAILDVAVKDRRLPSNPARGVNLPRKTPKRRVYLTHRQVTQLAAHSGHGETLVLFLAYTGLRWGEATALRVRDLVALKRRVNVVENAVDVAGRIIVGTPKTHKRRSVPYPAFLSEALARQCEGKMPDSLLFGDGNNHMHLPASRTGWFAAAVRKCVADDPTFPRVTPHDLRHTAASLSIATGANPKAVQRMLGHASAAMTLDTYADLFEDDLDDVAMALDSARFSASVAI